MELFHRYDAERHLQGFFLARQLIWLGPPVLTQAKFPDDVDTTSLGITILDQPLDAVDEVMNKMLDLRTPDGIMQVSDSHFAIDCNRD